MNRSRRFIWCILLKLSIEEINRRIDMHDLVQNADATLIKQVNCDVDRCDLPNDILRLKLKHLIISVFSYRKEYFSYIQGIHEIGRVFLTLFHEYKKTDLSTIKKGISKLNHFSNKNETIALCKLLIKKLNTEKGRIDICFKAFDKFLMIYSTPYICKPDNITQINLEYVLSKIVHDILHLLNHKSPVLYNFLINLKEKEERESKICMFILPWIITYFSYNISRKHKLIYYIFDNIISNHPLFIIFIVEEILIQCQFRLFDFLEQCFGSEASNFVEHEKYPFVHLYFQNLDISSLEWNMIIENAHKSLSNFRINELNSYNLWKVEKMHKKNFRISKPLGIKLDDNKTICSMLIIIIFSIMISLFINKFDFSKIIPHFY